MAQRIRGLPDHLAEIPDDKTGWLRWREDALLFREWCHRVASESAEKRAYLLELARKDPAFFMLVFGAILEPRDVADMRVVDGELVTFTKPRGWYPWVPYPFQVEMIRFIEDCVSKPHDPMGRGDGIIEKSRDMGATWIFCLYVAHQWLFADDFIAGMLSRKEDLVDSNDPSSMFYRIESLLGLNGKVPEKAVAPDTIYDGHAVRFPDWLIPAGYEPKLHNLKLNLRHPSRTNQIVGESTTSRSGIGTRTSITVIDEAAKIDDLLDIWSGMGPVTNHRFALSSADRRYGDGMYILANRAKLAAQDPTRPGASIMSVTWDKHPLRDGAWFASMMNRYEGDELGFNREYRIDWDAGMGDWVYPAAKVILPGHYPYDPMLGDVYAGIDPGLRDKASVVFFQYVPGENTYRVVESITLQTPTAEYLAPILMGFPPDAPIRNAYMERAIHEVMDFTWTLRQHGQAVTWIGDTYGDHRGGSGTESYYEALLRTSRELNAEYDHLPPVELIVMTKYDDGARFHLKRKESLGTLLPRLQFHDAPRVRYVLDAIQSNRYKSQEEGRLVQSEPNRPAHDWTSHPTSACEYFAVWAVILDLQKQPMVGATTLSAKRNQRNAPARRDPVGYTRL